MNTVPSISPPTVVEKLDIVSTIMEFEEGTQKPAQTIKMFQHLIDTGMVWKLQGMYGRLARDLIAQGQCHLPHPLEGHYEAPHEVE